MALCLAVSFLATAAAFLDVIRAIVLSVEVSHAKDQRLAALSAPHRRLLSRVRCVALFCLAPRSLDEPCSVDPDCYDKDRDVHGLLTSEFQPASACRTTMLADNVIAVNLHEHRRCNREPDRYEILW